MKFEKKIEEINKALDELKSDKLDLQSAMKVYKAGVLKLAEARKQLSQARLEVEEVAKGLDEE